MGNIYVFVSQFTTKMNFLWVGNTFQPEQNERFVQMGLLVHKMIFGLYFSFFTLHNSLHFAIGIERNDKQRRTTNHTNHEKVVKKTETDMIQSSKRAKKEREAYTLIHFFNVSK